MLLIPTEGGYQAADKLAYLAATYQLVGPLVVFASALAVAAAAVVVTGALEAATFPERSESGMAEIVALMFAELVPE